MATRLEDLNASLQAVFELTRLLMYSMTCADRPGQVLRINFEKGGQVYKAADGTVYVRHGAQSQPVKDPQRITELSIAKGAISYEDQLCRGIAPEAIVDSTQLRDQHEVVDFTHALHRMDCGPNRESAGILDERVRSGNRQPPRQPAGCRFNPCRVSGRPDRIRHLPSGCFARRPDSATIALLRW